jgi:ribosomal protein S27E
VIRNFLRKFMLGRYGPDHLGTAMLVVALVLSLIMQILGLGFVAVVSYILLALMIFRMLSRNIEARRRENDRFLRYWGPARTKIKSRVARLRDIKTHKYFTCPGCRNTLRVPRGRGKLQITCPRCGERFVRKT